MLGGGLFLSGTCEFETWGSIHRRYKLRIDELLSFFEHQKLRHDDRPASLFGGTEVIAGIGTESGTEAEARAGLGTGAEEPGGSRRSRLNHHSRIKCGILRISFRSTLFPCPSGFSDACKSPIYLHQLWDCKRDTIVCSNTLE
jgi:hypothetical protein